jgi:hypothetical protein
MDLVGHSRPEVARATMTQGQALHAQYPQRRGTADWMAATGGSKRRPGARRGIRSADNVHQAAVGQRRRLPLACPATRINAGTLPWCQLPLPIPTAGANRPAPSGGASNHRLIAHSPAIAAPARSAPGRHPGRQGNACAPPP